MHALRTHCENTRGLANTHNHIGKAHSDHGKVHNEQGKGHSDHGTPRPPSCHAHPEKPATHALPQPRAHPLPCCEKCSIMLASKGHNILRLASLPLKSPRQAQIEEFLGELRWHLGELGRRQWES